MQVVLNKFLDQLFIGNRYVIARMPKSGRVGITSVNINVDQPLLLTIQLFQTDNALISVCFNSTDHCQLIDSVRGKIGLWMNAMIDLPIYTTKVESQSYSMVIL
jgi:hypothetical protein